MVGTLRFSVYMRKILLMGPSEDMNFTVPNYGQEVGCTPQVCVLPPLLSSFSCAPLPFLFMKLFMMLCYGHTNTNQSLEPWLEMCLQTLVRADWGQCYVTVDIILPQDKFCKRRDERRGLRKRGRCIYSGVGVGVGLGLVL